LGIAKSHAWHLYHSGIVAFTPLFGGFEQYRDRSSKNSKGAITVILLHRRLALKALGIEQLEMQAYYYRPRENV
jgi:hypothetical protein